MAAYDRAIADPATLERVLADKRDGEAGVPGTPTFFRNGVQLRLRPRRCEHYGSASQKRAGRRPRNILVTRHCVHSDGDHNRHGPTAHRQRSYRFRGPREP